MTEGRIHSIESMGLVDGPGIRTVVFMQGCALRCMYCHNPDTWNFNGGVLTSSDELLSKLVRYKTYYTASGGGVTFSGGEPLMQPEFLAEMLKKCKENDIHTCIDTAGFGKGKYDEILCNTDLVLYDVKHFEPESYKSLTGHDMSETLRFLKKIEEFGVQMYVRHVIVPGITDGEDHIKKLKKYIATLPGVIKTELLPYHLLGVNKYKEMGIPYSLDGVKAMNQDTVDIYQKIIDSDFGG